MKWVLEVMGRGISYAPLDVHQVLGASWFHCRMDWDPNATNDRRPRVLDDRPRVLDNVLWWITDEERHQHGVGLHFPLSVRMRYMVHLHFPAYNNVAKYEALINDLLLVVVNNHIEPST
jgi:hypothetical protein